MQIYTVTIAQQIARTATSATSIGIHMRSKTDPASAARTGSAVDKGCVVAEVGASVIVALVAGGSAIVALVAGGPVVVVVVVEAVVVEVVVVEVVVVEAVVVVVVVVLVVVVSSSQWPWISSSCTQFCPAGQGFGISQCT